MTAAPSPAATGPGPAPGSAWAHELAFAIETAAAAGAVLMDRYERLERIDHKSARDVVTEADHQSEELVIAAMSHSDRLDSWRNASNRPLPT